MFFNGQPLGKANRYIFLPQRVEFRGQGNQTLLRLKELSNTNIRNANVKGGLGNAEYRVMRIQPGKYVIEYPVFNLLVILYRLFFYITNLISYKFHFS